MHVGLKASLTCLCRVRRGKSSSGNSHFGGGWCLINGVTLRYMPEELAVDRQMSGWSTWIEQKIDLRAGRRTTDINCVRSMVAGQEVQGVVGDSGKATGARGRCVPNKVLSQLSGHFFGKEISLSLTRGGRVGGGLSRRRVWGLDDYSMEERCAGWGNIFEFAKGSD